MKARLAILDIGSNSVRLVVCEKAGRQIDYLINRKALCGLGMDLVSTGRLSGEGRTVALQKIKEFVTIAKHQEATVVAVATAAVRNANDGLEFCHQVEETTGVKVRVLSGEEEAVLAARGLVSAFPDASGLVCDMGGSSVELASVEEGVIGHGLSSPLGPQHLMSLDGMETSLARFVGEQTKLLFAGMQRTDYTLYLVGGSWRLIGKLNLTRLGLPEKQIHGHETDPTALTATLNWILAVSPQDLAKLSKASAKRLSMAPYAALVLQEILTRFTPRRVIFSRAGLREGLLFQSNAQLEHRVQI